MKNVKPKDNLIFHKIACNVKVFKQNAVVLTKLDKKLSNFKQNANISTILP